MILIDTYSVLHIIDSNSKLTFSESISAVGRCQNVSFGNEGSTTKWIATVGSPDSNLM